MPCNHFLKRAWMVSAAVVATAACGSGGSAKAEPGFAVAAAPEEENRDRGKHHPHDQSV